MYPSPPIDQGPSTDGQPALFARLQRRHSRFVWPVTALFLTFYLGTIVAVTYARSAMSVPVLEEVNLGLLLVLLNFPLTFAIAAGYRWYAGRHLDPLASRFRDETEAAHGAEVTR